jgi:DNA modification methylase
MAIPPLKIQLWPIDRLIPYGRNARTHSDQQIAQIAASIAEFGFISPVLAEPDGSLIAGHGRLLAARKLRYTEVPVIVLAHLNENQKRAFMLADNQLALNAGWNEEMLRLELEALAQAAYDLEITGFDQQELDRLLTDLNRQVLTDPEEAPPLEPETVTKSGDLWIMGDHRLLCGDSTQRDQLEKVLEGRSSEMVFTDLPYNTAYEGKTSKRMTITNDNLGDQFADFLCAACRAMLAVNLGSVYICMSSRELHNLFKAFCQAGGHWSTYIIWAKHTFTLGRADFQRQYEPLLYGWREGHPHHWCGDRDQGDVWFIDKPHCNREHPTMKPVELVERAITNSSRKGDLILDPFAGAGTTVVAAERIGRQARVLEIDPQYADVIVRRWQNYTGADARLESAGLTFAQVSEQRRAAREVGEEKS